jgi:hypothetical protein
VAAAPPPPSAIASTPVAPPATIATVACEVTLTDASGNSATFSPGPADASGSCAAWQAAYPTGSVTTQPITATAGGGGLN